MPPVTPQPLPSQRQRIDLQREDLEKEGKVVGYREKPMSEVINELDEQVQEGHISAEEASSEFQRLYGVSLPATSFEGL